MSIKQKNRPQTRNFSLADTGSARVWVFIGVRYSAMEHKKEGSAGEMGYIIIRHVNKL